MKRLTIMMFAVCLAATALTAQAQEPQQTETADDRTEALETKVSALEKIVDKLPKLSGFVQLLYNYENSSPVTSHFRVRRARLIASGNIFRNYADYNLTVEFAGTVKPIDAFVRLTPWKQFNVQIGAFRPAFSLENLNYGATTMELIDYPQIVMKMTTLSDISGIANGSTGRDLGIQAYGGLFNKRGFSTVQYYVGVFNGAGLEFNTGNSDKNLAAMLRINPVKDLALVGSVYIGTWAPSGAGSYAKRNRWSGGFMFDNKAWFLRGEYLGGVTGGMTGNNLLVKPENGRLVTDGAFIMGGAWFCNRRIAPVVRAEYYSQNADARSQTTDIFYTAGILYCPWRYLRLQVNYTAKTYTYADRCGHQAMVMLTGMF